MFRLTGIYRTLFVFFAIVTAVAFFLLEGSERPTAQEKTPKSSTFDKFSKQDAVTDAIRDRNVEIVRVSLNNIGDRDKAAKLGRIVGDYGSFVVVVKNKKNVIVKSGLDEQKIDTTINLPGSKFEPRIDPPAGTIATDSDAVPARSYYVVQFGGIVKDEWLESLRDAGVEVLQYVPHQAFFVYGDGEAIKKAAGHSRVRWVGAYTAEQKLSQHVNDFAGSSESDTATFDIAVFSRADLRRVANEFRSQIKGRILQENALPSNFFNTLRVEMNRGELGKAASMPDVFRIDPYIKPVAEDERAAHIISGNYTNPTTISAPGYNPLTQFGADGTGVTVAVSDDGISIPGNGGFYITSANTVDGPLRGATSGAAGGHGHINASIISGNTPFGALDGQGYNYGLGVAPKANIINIPFLKTGNTTSDAQSVDDTLNTLGPNGVRGTISNNSWGAGTNSNAYDSFAGTYDGFIRDASFAGTIDPITMVFSAGNSGAAGLTRPKMAKNIIAVANAENLRPELSSAANNIDDMSNTSSHGPAGDGRIKPDITAPGTVITGSRAGSCASVSSCFDANHAYSSGTSHAAPQVAGAAALFTQYWKNANSGVYPSPAMIKASILLSGQEMNGNLTTLPIPNGNEGWGRMNMKLMMNTGVAMKYVDQATNFAVVGESVVYSGTVADATKPVRITLVWTDPPAAANPALVNNLDLTVAVGATLYRGNVFSGGQSTTGGILDPLNNVEHVWIPAGTPVGTPINVTVLATALNGDGTLGNADVTDQNFALVAYNFSEAATNVNAPFDFTGDNRTDLSIYRAAQGEWWYTSTEAGGGSGALQFGSPTDTIVPGDFTGDGKADFAFWRPSTGEWFVLRSENSTFFAFPFGTNGDIPAPGDFDNDGRTDAAVYRPGSTTWFILNSGGGTTIQQFGLPTDLPAVADYDGDGKADIAIYRPNGASGGEWWISRSTGGVNAFQFGSATDKIVQGDYTGDGKADAAFWRPSTGQWFILRSENSTFFAFPFGSNGDIPVPGDYDGDGRLDAAVFRPTSATWFVNRSTAGIYIAGFGLPTDQPVPNAYVR